MATAKTTTQAPSSATNRVQAISQQVASGTMSESQKAAAVKELTSIRDSLLGGGSSSGAPSQGTSSGGGISYAGKTGQQVAADTAQRVASLQSLLSTGSITEAQKASAIAEMQSMVGALSSLSPEQRAQYAGSSDSDRALAITRATTEGIFERNAAKPATPVLSSDSARSQQELLKKKLTDISPPAPSPAGQTTQGQATPVAGQPVTAQPAPAVTADSAGKLTSTDPLQQAIITANEKQSQLLDKQMADLDVIASRMRADSAAMIQDIKTSYANRRAQLEEENKRVAQATIVAGIAAGRAQYTPEAEEQIVSNAIQSGIMKIKQLDAEERSEILKARTAENEMDYKLFTESANKALAANKQKIEAITDLHSMMIADEDRLMKKQQFALTMENAGIEKVQKYAELLAPQIASATRGMSPANRAAYVARVAAENGLNPEAFTGALDTAGKAGTLADLKMESARADLRKTNAEIEKVKNPTKTAAEDKPMEKAQLDTFLQSYGWKPAYGTTLKEAIAFQNENKGLTPSELKKKMNDEIIGAEATVESIVPQIMARVSADKTLKNTLFDKADELNIAKWTRGAEGDIEALLAQDVPRTRIQELFKAGYEAKDITQKLREDLSFFFK